MKSRLSEFLIRAMLLILAITLGLASRRFGSWFPNFVATYSGDTLWATALFLVLGMFLPKAPNWMVAVLAFSISVIVELSQLYHASWIDSLRATTLGGLVLGFRFLWSDIVCYAVGVLIGIVVQTALIRLLVAPRG